MKRLPLIFIMVASLFGMVGCSKCKDSPVTSDIKQYFFNFKPGSYWIYKNVQNGDVDSVYVVKRDSAIVVWKNGCFNEQVFVTLNGFAKNKIFDYFVKGWTTNVEILPSSNIAFNGDYKLLLGNKVINKITYENVLTIDDYCFTGGCGGCYCNEKFFRFEHLFLAKNVGIIRWEANYHPVYGTVAYDLVRHKIIF